MNANDSQMRKTGQMTGGEFGTSNLGQLSQTGNNFGNANSSNAATLKGKLASLEEQIQLVADEMNTHKKDVVSLKNELKDKIYKRELNKKVNEDIEYYNQIEKQKKAQKEHSLKITMTDDEFLTYWTKSTDLHDIYSNVGNDELYYDFKNQSIM